MKLIAALTPALLLAGAASAAPRSETYRAVGTEPGWTLTVERGTIRYVGDYGRTRVTTKAPVARPSFNGRRYVTRRITVDITRATCSDGMSDRAFPERVTVTIGRRTVRGCGGVPTATSAQLDGSRWRIVSADGQPVSSNRAELRFTADRVSGNAGCNSFGGAYRIVSGQLETTRIISTKMACVGPNGNPATAERKVLSILTGPSRVTIDDGTMTLSGAAGSIALRRAN